MGSAEWREVERTFPRPLPELRRLVVRGRRRVGVAVLGALAVAAAAIAALALRSAQYEGQVVLRVSEGVFSDETGMPQGELRGYVESALLTREVLLEIIESEDLFASKREQGEQLAIDALRDALEIDIYGNFFATWRRIGPRSLRIRVTYRSGDRAEAAAVPRAIARMIESAERSHRRRRFSEGTDVSQSVIVRAEERLEEEQRRFAEQVAALGRAERAGDRIHAGALRLRAHRLSDALHQQQRTLRDALLEHSELEFRRAAAREQLGLLFTVVDQVIPPRPPQSAWLSLAALGGALFVLVFPFAGIAAGAFDGRLHDRDDVARLGLPALGHVPRFRGHQLGAIRSRRRHKRRLRDSTNQR